MHIYDNILLNSSWNEKCFRQICGEDQNTHFMFNNFFPKIVAFMRQWGKNMEEPDRPQIQYSTAYGLFKVDNLCYRQRECAIHIDFTRQQWYRERASM
jgi:hypothetical protein